MVKWYKTLKFPKIFLQILSELTNAKTKNEAIFNEIME
jgi:hypothetical protein